MRPKERVKERAPICEPGDPIALERCYVKEPEEWTEETLRAAVEMQRKEREGRLAAKARRKVKERVKDDDGGGELGEGDSTDVGGGGNPSEPAGGSDAGEGPPKRKR